MEKSHLKYRTLGQGLKVSAIGIGCMPMIREGNIDYGAADDATSTRTIHEAIDLGVTFFDTAELYGPFRNEELVGAAIRGRREELIIATKFAMRFDGDTPMVVDGSPENVRRACEGSLKRLGIDTIDLFYQHRVDPNVPIEETVGAMAELVTEGKVRFLGLSEAAANTVRRAVKTHPIAALQSEYSIWERDVEADILSACRENGVGFVPYSPLGRGFLAGEIRSLTSFRPTTGATTIRVTRPKTCPRTSPSWMRSPKWPNGTAFRTRRWRWLGSWPRATTSCRSPA